MSSSTASSGGPLVIGCVTEPVQKYIQQAARLLLSVRWFGGEIANAPFILCTTGKLPAAAESFFTRRGAEIVAVERVSAKHGPSNKIRFLELSKLDNWQHILLLDCDTILAQDPSAFLSCTGFAAKIADAPTVKTDEFRQLFAHFGMDMPAERYEHDFVAKPCIPYFNSGVILLNSAWRQRFVDAWNHFNYAILDKWHKISMTPIYTDQASLALAIESIGIPVKQFPNSMNLGCHWPAHGYPAHFGLIDPLIIHYHGLFDENGYITRTPLEQTNRRIDTFNARLRAEKLASPTMRHIPRQAVNDKLTTPQQPKVVVGSGWWCEDKDRVGSAAATTTTAFFYLWYAQVLNCLSPSSIVITDSRSPLKPDYQSFELIRWIELDCDDEHADDDQTGKIQAKYSGFTASLINGCVHALNCNADYYVYVAQDCLLKGDNFLTEAIGECTEDILINAVAESGNRPHEEPVTTKKTTSLIIVKRSGMERLVSSLIRADREENLGSADIIITLEQHLQPVGAVQIPYGCSRPIEFRKSHFYVQHLSADELNDFIEGADLTALNNDLVSKPFYEILQAGGVNL